MRRTVLFLPRIRTLLAPRVAPPLAALLLVFSFAGCLATNVNVRSGGDGDGGGVLVRVFENADDAKARRVRSTGTLVELFAIDEQGHEVFLQRSLAGEWGVSQLAPGKYRLRVVAVLDANGNIRETRTGDRKTDFRVKNGQTAEVKIILKKTPTGLIVAATVTVVVIVAAIAAILGHNDVKPPLPKDVFRNMPPPPPLLPRVVIAPDLWVGPVAVPVPRERRAAPRVTSVIPEPDSIVASRRVTPTLTLTQPLDESKLDEGVVLMLGTQSGMITGTISVHQGLLRFAPSRELVPGETVTVTVRRGGIVNPEGTRMAEDFSWSFQVEP